MRYNPFSVEEKWQERWRKAASAAFKEGESPLTWSALRHAVVADIASRRELPCHIAPCDAWGLRQPVQEVCTDIGAVCWEESPQNALERVGADVVRMYLVMTGPLSHSIKDDGKALESAWRFIHRLWGLVPQAAPSNAPDPALSEQMAQLMRDMECEMARSRYHKALAYAHTGVKMLTPYVQAPTAQSWDALHAFVLALAPICPHLCAQMEKVLMKKELDTSPQYKVQLSQTF